MHPRRYQSSLPLSVSPYAMRFDRSLPLCIVALNHSPLRLLYLILHVYCTFRILPLRNLYYSLFVKQSSHPHPHAYFGPFKLFVSTPPTSSLVNVVTSPSPVVSYLASFFPDHHSTLQECLKGVICRLTFVYTTESPFLCESQYQIIVGSTTLLLDRLTFRTLLFAARLAIQGGLTTAPLPRQAVYVRV